MIQWTKIIWVNNQRWLINSFSKPNKSKKSRKVDWLLFLISLITHYTLHNTQYILNTTQHTLCTTHYTLHSIWVAWLQPNRWKRTGDRGQRTEERGHRTEDRGQRTEERGKRKEDRGRRTKDRGQRTEDLKLIWSLSFNWLPMVDQTLGVFLKRLWGRDCVSKVTDCQFSFEAWTWNLPYIMFQLILDNICEGKQKQNVLWVMLVKGAFNYWIYWNTLLLTLIEKGLHN